MSDRSIKKWIKRTIGNYTLIGVPPIATIPNIFRIFLDKCTSKIICETYNDLTLLKRVEFKIKSVTEEMFYLYNDDLEIPFLIKDKYSVGICVRETNGLQHTNTQKFLLDDSETKYNAIINTINYNNNEISNLFYQRF